MAQTAIIRPMRAEHMVRHITEAHLKQDGYLYFQPKIDGMRVLCHEGQPRTRSWKTWKNRYLQAFTRDHAEEIQGWDAEMLPGHELDPNIFREAMSGLRSEDGSREFTLYLFDNFDPSWAHLPYANRFTGVQQDLVLPTEEADMFDPTNTWDTPTKYFMGMTNTDGTGEKYCVKVVLCPTFIVRSMDEIDEMERAFLLLGWEGGMLRRIGTRYKYGKSTELEGALTKVKRFKDGEAVITGVYARERNDNEATISDLGYTVRTAHQGNKVALECVGGFNVDLLDNDTGKPYEPRMSFKIGVFDGVDMPTKEKWWQIRDQLVGRIVSFRDQEYTGGYDLPRTPVFFGFRDPLEL